MKIAKALVEMHSNNIVHCDLRPENIIVNSDLSDLKIINYAQSTFAGENQAIEKFKMSCWNYLPPEILQKFDQEESVHKVSQAIDVWSFGVTLLEIISGCPVWLDKMFVV